MASDHTSKEANDIPLGKEVDYTDQYSPDLLFPIQRSESRASLGIKPDDLPFYGVDVWNAYELSWLNAKGKPQVARAEFRVPCDSPSIIESKSFKLYLNSFNQSRFDSWQQVEQTLQADLSRVAGKEVVTIISPLDQLQPIAAPVGTLLDELDVSVDSYRVAPELLAVGKEQITEQCYSQLLRSLCPVTGQPDWGSIHISYTGKAIDHEGLLRYIISFRQHQDFHEHCVERIYSDIMRVCQPDDLHVFARYVRRGGLDINPYRSRSPLQVYNTRLVRQ